MADNIILIGPMGTGKSTQGRLLAEALEMPQVSLDDRRWKYYDEIGFDREAEKTISAAEGLSGVYRYWKPFEAHAVERVLSEFAGFGCIIDFGAGHSVYEDEVLLARVRAALASEPNVVLLLPSPDPEESIRLLSERNPELNTEVLDLNAHFVRHPSNGELARITIYTQGKTPEQTRDDILNALPLIHGMKKCPD